MQAIEPSNRAGAGDEAQVPLGPPAPLPIEAPPPSELSTRPSTELSTETTTPSVTQNAEPNAAPDAELADESPSPMLSMVLLGVAAFALFTVIMRTYRRRGGSRARAEASAAERIAEIRADAHDRSGADDASAEAVDLITSLIAQLDARAARLETLVERAEHAIAQLDESPGSPRRPHADTPISRIVPDAAEAPRVSDSIHQRVYDLADAGQGPVDIARALGQPTGQIELILALRRRA
ncbi:MAG: hypothetical protein AAGK04_01535 [Planctomycetota bacterium]